MCCAQTRQAAPGGSLRKPKDTDDDASQVRDLVVSPDLRSEQDDTLGPTPGAGAPGAALLASTPAPHNRCVCVRTSI